MRISISAVHLKTFVHASFSVAAIKTETITLHIDPSVKSGLKEVASMERRSLANMIEVMIRQYCDDAGVAIPDTDPGKRRNKVKM